MTEAEDLQPRAGDDSTPGAILKHERERLGLSVQQAADDLHLDPWIVEAIEANRFVTLGAPVYARGHLRKYATRLGLPEDDVINRYERLQDRPLVTDPIPAALADPVRPPRRSLKGPAWIAIGIFALGAIGWVASEIFFKGPSEATFSAPITSTAPAAEVASEGSAVETPEPTQQSETDTPVDPAPSATPAEATSPPLSAPVAEPETSASSAAASNAEPIQLRLEYSGESWTEIYDATGARLVFAAGTSGRVRTVTGVPPIQVNLGSVSAVSLQVNGQPVAIPRREGRESSRFVIEPDGNLR